MFQVGDGKRLGNTMRASIRSEKTPHVRHILAAIVDRALPLVHTTSTSLPLRVPDPQALRTGPGHLRAVWDRVVVVHSAPLQLCVPVPAPDVPPEPTEDVVHRMGLAGGSAGACGIVLGVGVPVRAWCGGGCY